MGIDSKIASKGGYEEFLKDSKSIAKKKAKLLSFMEEHGLEGNSDLYFQSCFFYSYY